MWLFSLWWLVGGMWFSIFWFVGVVLRFWLHTAVVVFACNVGLVACQLYIIAKLLIRGSVLSCFAC